MTKHDENNIPEILAGEGTWFTAKLIRLIAGADNDNRARLHLGFPEVVEAVNLHQHGHPGNYGGEMFYQNHSTTVGDKIKKENHGNN